MYRKYPYEQTTKKPKSTTQSNFTRIIFISILYSPKKFIILVTLSFYVQSDGINVYYNEFVVRSCRVNYLFRTRPLFLMGVSGGTPRVGIEIKFNPLIEFMRKNPYNHPERLLANLQCAKKCYKYRYQKQEFI